MKRLLLIFATVFCLAAMPPFSDNDYQGAANHESWQWDPYRTECVYYAYQRTVNSQIDQVAMVADPTTQKITFTFSFQGKPLFAWQGHRYTTFAIANDVLYYTDYAPDGTGGFVVAVDLKTGKPQWRTPLEAAHTTTPEKTTQDNRICLRLNGGAVVLTGWDAQGRYIEYKEIKEGKTVGHKIFPPDQSPTPKPTPPTPTPPK